MKIFIVIPCLNEQENLWDTCKSLDFGMLKKTNTILVLVDNGSTDHTLSIMTRVRECVGAQHVSIIREYRKGYVYARNAGVLAITEHLRKHRSLDEPALVLQADADTIYQPGYIENMQYSFVGSGLLIEGAAVTGKDFVDKFREFDKLCRNTDSEIERWFASDDDQIVVDDKVCGFLLSDYWRWGGHQRDFDSLGREIYAETTRLLIRGKEVGEIKREKVDSALAVPSRRKLLSQGPAYFASAGFPRSSDWVKSWGESSKDSDKFLTSPFSWGKINSAIRSRQRHALAFFSILPEIYKKRSDVLPEFYPIVKKINKNKYNPSYVLENLLSLVDEDGGVLDQFIDGNV
ncbi:glycosyltransferase family A protein [Hahella aquimaris]|uniref:glycosyltransferase family 2 protein n=1 Tax=Hahella sp. HNIBRBA332 TaxID=3015983 RepID=UPI00273B47C1|nr:glycosyltransferase family A protein [Hahella sp. HNIBRBA332]WLQ16499.1 glycosyltransferase family A protein [Hahella sp. HNIBRBA332]